VISKEIEREGIPVAFITAMTKIAMQQKANRIVTGVRIPHPCGDPSLPPEADLALRRKIVECALEAVQTKVEHPTVFMPGITYASG